MLLSSKLLRDVELETRFVVSLRVCVSYRTHGCSIFSLDLGGTAVDLGAISLKLLFRCHVSVHTSQMGR